VLVRLSGALSLNGMLHGPVNIAMSIGAAPLVLVAVGLFLVLLAENARIPVDDPNTHLELTMIHEAMILDNSGPLLGMALYGAAVKLFVTSTLLLHVIAPFRLGQPLLDWGLFAAELVGLAVIVGLVESLMARLQMRHVPALLIAAVLCCSFAYALLIG